MTADPPPAAAATATATPRIGVLAVQGDVAENVSSLRASAAELGLGAGVAPVTTPGEIASLDGLVIPGGESTTIGRMSLAGGSLDMIRQRAASGMPVLGICAGMVLLAGSASDRVVGGTEQPLLDLLPDVKLERNSFGRQRQSFEADISLDPIGIPNYRGVFIRAPAIISHPSSGTGAEPIAWLGGKTVAVKKGNIVGVSFHPELTEDLAVHRYFTGLVAGGLKR